jgi:maltooligosyltrehalose trehalohydrolase
VWLDWFRALLAIRARWLSTASYVASLDAHLVAPRALCAGWQVDEQQWWLAINVGSDEVQLTPTPGDVVFRIGAPLPDGRLAPDSLVVWVRPLP